MAHLLSQALNLSYKNCVKTGFAFSKHYSVLSCYNKLNYDNRLGRNNVSHQKTQYRNLSFEGFWRAIDGISNSYVCGVIRDNIFHFHEATGLPWWSVIALTTGAARIALVALIGIYQEKVVTQKWLLAKNSVTAANVLEKEGMALAKKNNWTLEKTVKMINEKNKEKRKEEMQLGKLLLFRTVVLIFTQVGLWLMVTLSIRSLNHIAYKGTEAGDVLHKELSTEGTLWFQNLLKPDKFILPAILVFWNLAIIEIHSLKLSTKTGIMTYLLRGLTLVLGYICTKAPSNVSLFWAVSSFVALIQTIVLLSPRIRTIFRIGPVSIRDGDPKHPYRILWKRFKIKYGI